MTAGYSEMLSKARESIQAARVLQREGFHDFSASRSYYAMLYVAEALLLHRGLSFASHAAVHSAFGREFAKTDVAPRIYHQRLVEAFVFRLAGDYDTGHSVPPGIADELILQSEDFLSFAADWLGQQGAQ